MKSPIVVFDLDGTLVDTAPDLLASLNHALSHAGLDPVVDDGFRRNVGHGARVMLEKAFLAAGKVLSQQDLNTLLGHFLDHYTASMPGTSKPYEHVLESIDALAADGYLVAICTNKTEATAIRLLQALKIDNLFSAICGQDTFAVRKPDPAHLTGTIDLANGDWRRAVMIGDSETDILTAKAAGIPVVAVDFGYTEKHVSEFAPDHVISHYKSLDPELVASLLARRPASG